MKRYFKIASMAVLLIFIAVVFSDNPFEPKQQQPRVKENNNKIVDTNVMSNASVVQSDSLQNRSKMEKVSDDMQLPGYWTNKIEDGNKVIMSPKEIQAFNNDIYNKILSVVNIQNYNDTISDKTLVSYINKYTIPSKIYDSAGKLLGNKFSKGILSNLNLDSIKPSNEVMFGLTIRKTSVRSFPNDISVYNSPKDNRLDRFQQTGCGACEMVAILHKSKDSLWYFVQTSNYKGWVKAEDIGIVQNKKEVVDYVNNKNFIVINCNYVTIKFTMENGKDFTADYFMGTKMPIVKESEKEYLVSVPIKDMSGNVTYKNVCLSKSLDISKGYLEYTRDNILNQAFKLSGVDYDWGDKNKGRDCSSFILSIYKSFGFDLPRDTDEQEKIPGKVYTFNKNILESLKPGATIFMNGHVVMYLGKDNGKHYIIHSFLGYGGKKDSVVSFVPMYKVSVTEAEVCNASGIAYTNKFTKAIQIEK